MPSPDHSRNSPRGGVPPEKRSGEPSLGGSSKQKGFRSLLNERLSAGSASGFNAQQLIQLDRVVAAASPTQIVAIRELIAQGLSRTGAGATLNIYAQAATQFIRSAPIDEARGLAVAAFDRVRSFSAPKASTLYAEDDARALRTTWITIALEGARRISGARVIGVPEDVTAALGGEPLRPGSKLYLEIQAVIGLRTDGVSRLFDLAVSRAFADSAGMGQAWTIAGQCSSAEVRCALALLWTRAKEQETTNLDAAARLGRILVRRADEDERSRFANRVEIALAGRPGDAVSVDRPYARGQLRTLLAPPKLGQSVEERKDTERVAAFYLRTLGSAVAVEQGDRGLRCVLRLLPCWQIESRLVRRAFLEAAEEIVSEQIAQREQRPENTAAKRLYEDFMRNPRSTPELLMRKFDQLGQKDVAWKAVAAEVRAKFFPKPPEPPIVVAPPPPPVVAPPATVTPSVPPVEPASNHRASAPRAGRQRHRRGSRPAASPAPNQRGDLLQDLIEELAAPHKGKPTVAVRGPMYADGGGQWGATVGVADLAISSGQNLAEQAERVISMLEGETRFLILDARKLSEAPPLKLTTQECVDRLTQSQSPELIGVATTTIVRLLEGSQALRHPNAVVPRAIYCRALLQLLPFAKGAVPNDRISRTIEEHRIDLTKVVEATRPQDRRRVLAGIELLRADSK